MKAALLTEDSDARMATIYQVNQWPDRPLRRARRATKEELKAYFHPFCYGSCVVHSGRGLV